jgi:hypothetical protein
MKKVLVVLVALLALAGAAFFVFKKTVGNHVPAAQMVPGDTLLFVNLPDVARTGLRWPETGLAKIVAEPETQKFLEKFRASNPQWDQKIVQIKKLAPREAFVAVTSIEGAAPKWIAGFAFLGRKSDAAALLSEPRAELKKAQPTGKSDIINFGGTEVETFTFGETVVAEAFKEDWYLISNNVDLLKTTLTAASLPTGAPDALGKKEIYQKAVAKLPADGDLVMFSQLGSLTETLTALWKTSGQAVDPKQIEEIKRMQAVAWGTKLEGAQIRDTVFLLAPGGTAEPPLPRNALAFSAADTFLYYGMALPAKIEMPDSAGLVGGYLPMLGLMEKALATKNLQWSDLSVAFGPELGAVVDWGQKELQPSALFAVDVRDPAKARAFVDVFTGTAPGTPPWGRKEENGVTLFQSPQGEGLLPIAPAVALTDKFLVFGFSSQAVQAGLERLKTGQASIARSPAYANALKDVTAPTSGFGYLDTKAFVERSYSTLSSVAMVVFMLHPDLGLDAGKLPSASTISRHLQPSIYSQSVTEEGTLIESTGTLTFNQVLVATIGGSVAAALPKLQETLSGDLTLDPKTGLPAFPSLGAPSSPLPSVGTSDVPPEKAPEKPEL